MGRRLRLFLIILVTVVFVGGAFIWQRLSYANVCVDIKTNQQVENCLEILPQLRVDLESIYKVIRLPAIGEAILVMNQLEPILPYRNYFMGVGRPTSYIVLLLNDQELRTNGGFMGSYAVGTMTERVAEIKFQDIYVPDGQINGYVEPPAPIQDAFKTGSHRLPNADWSPDFPRSAAAIRWFFEKGGEVNPDVLATITLSTVKEILGIVGPVEVPEYQMTVTSENIYKWLQDNAEVGFFPGSTQKRDAISAIGNALINKSKNIGWRKQVKIARLLLDDLNSQNILVSSLNDEVEKVFLDQNWSGVYSPLPCPTSEDCQMLTTGIVEMNLGANKANCCVTRNTLHKLSKAPEGFIHLIEVKLKNFSTTEEPTRGYFYGGNYLSYFRFYLPIEATNITVIAHPSVLPSLGTWPVPYDGEKGRLDIDEVYGFKEVGFFHITRAGEETIMDVSYLLPDQGKENFYLAILKQHGVKKSLHQFDVFGEIVSDDLTNDLVVKIDR